MNPAPFLVLWAAAAPADRWAVHYTPKVIEVVDADGAVAVSEAALRAGAGVRDSNDPLTRWKVLWMAGELMRRNNRAMP